MQGHALVEVEGVPYSVRFQGFAQPLEVFPPSGQKVVLPPWTLRDHLLALEQHVKQEEHGLSFDAAALARDVLGRAGVPDSSAGELVPLAAWWASGGDRPTAVEPDAATGWVQVGSVRVRLRPWTFAERARALSASVSRQADGSRSFRLGAYLLEMVHTSVLAMDPALPGGLEALDAASAAALIDAVVAQNLPDVSCDPEDPSVVQATLRICAALGWTPAQVWAAPAPEVARLLGLLDRAGSGTPQQRPAARPRRLADEPDAIVIQVEDG